MKEEDLSLIKRYSIVEYLERKGIKPVRRTPAYALYRSPLRAETHPSFKVDTEKNLWIDYAEGRGGSIIDLYMRLESCTLLEAICHLGRNAPDDSAYSSRNDFASNYFQPSMVANGARNTDKYIRHLAATFTGVPYKSTLHQLGKCKAIPQMYQLRGKGQAISSHRLCQLIGRVRASG